MLRVFDNESNKSIMLFRKQFKLFIVRSISLNSTLSFTVTFPKCEWNLQFISRKLFLLNGELINHLMIIRLCIFFLSFLNPRLTVTRLPQQIYSIDRRGTSIAVDLLSSEKPFAFFVPIIHWYLLVPVRARQIKSAKYRVDLVKGRRMDTKAFQ